MKSANFSVGDLLAQCDKAIADQKGTMALLILKRAQELHPDNPNVLERLAEVLLEQGEAPQALEVLERCVRVDPKGNPTKWLYLAQFKSGKESLQCFNHGLELFQEIQRTLPSNADEAQKMLLSVQISNCYCSMAELFTTDLCDEADAESNCRGMLQLSLKACPQNPEAHFSQANFLLIVGELEQAKSHLQSCLTILAQLANAERPLIDVSYEFLLNVGKLCIELEDVDPAVEIFQQALTIDDHFPETWYLAGLSLHRKHESKEALSCLERAHEMLTKAKEHGEEVDPSLEEAVQVIAQEARQELQSQLDDSSSSAQ